MTSKRTYHKWSDEEVMLLYQTVIGSNRNWRVVESTFPQFSLLQLQNKFTLIEKQYHLKNISIAAINTKFSEASFAKSQNVVSKVKKEPKAENELVCETENNSYNSQPTLQSQVALQTATIPNSSKGYHHWTNEETLLLYKTVQKNRNNWKEVMKALPQFSLLQLQNKYVMIQKQFKLRMKNKYGGLDDCDNQSGYQQDLVISDDTLQVLLDLISKKE
ncbi:SANT/Myb_domain [Hexamita inflata]|uniref:SANT/Myb domain n=1 Tax=Hexamita inflata TaxID=28002 RepID=A0AA86QJ56_9EUKA|nr:SANT/Myb domain [Hexamita inflata]CAI9953234.1 SANT/Myb domain [Hexamita inflata]CAI9959700.1 SANT/Myb domain [Hexamita inflata]CAI9959702.1 SANT/Myb domain [Hexamita inflata]